MLWRRVEGCGIDEVLDGTEDDGLKRCSSVAAWLVPSRENSPSRGAMASQPGPSPAAVRPSGRTDGSRPRRLAAVDDDGENDGVHLTTYLTFLTSFHQIWHAVSQGNRLTTTLKDVAENKSAES